MKNSSLKTVRNILGFYELDVNGRILYAYLLHDIKPEKTNDEMFLNQNFFSDLFKFENADELRHRYLNFVATNFSTQSFTFFAEIFGQTVPLRIMLVRSLKPLENNSQASIFLDIKLN